MGLIFLGTQEKDLYISLEEQEARRIKRLKAVDISIVLLAVAICGFILAYYQTYEMQQYVLLGVFACIGLYYAIRLIPAKQEEKPAAAPEIKSVISGIAMLNEHGIHMKEWNLEGLVSLIIGKNTKNKEVDIDLSDSAYDALIHEEHALMNFAAGNWYLEGLHKPAGISIKKINDTTRYRLTDNKPCKLDRGDIVYIANTRLLIK